MFFKKNVIFRLKTIMANINLIIPKILHWEGGFSNNPLDLGGATNKGVTIQTFQAVYGANMTVEDLKNLSDEQFKAILKHFYWDKMLADLINNQSISEICVDWVWGSGTGIIHHIQELVGVTPDNCVGQKTINAINSQEPQILFNKIKKARLDFVDAIIAHNPSQKVFEIGWKNRINSYNFSS